MTLSATLINLNSLSGGDINLNSNNNIGLNPPPTGFIIMTNLPTSSAGLPTGAIWNNGGVLNIV
jgi:hypothetical protein